MDPEVNPGALFIIPNLEKAKSGLKALIAIHGTWQQDSPGTLG